MSVVLITEEHKLAFSGYAPEYLREDMLQDETVSLGAVDDETGTAAGVLISNVFNNWVEIVWVYVGEEYRGRGFAREMLEKLMAQAVAVPDLEGITAQLGKEDTSKAFHDLLRSELFRFRDEEDSIYVLTVDMLAGNSFWKDSVGRENSAAVPVGEIPTFVRDSFEKHIASLPEGIPIRRPVPWSDCDPNFSMGYLKNDKLVGLLLITRDGDDVELSFAYAEPGENLALASMLRAAGHKIMQTMPKETQISLMALNDTSASLVEKLFPELGRGTMQRAVYPFYRK
ncbi:MAG: GNAT family N-acetyltransferase [Clostridiales Family XIII bacterium]|nr:GNAT family N-acetyltransferase [Clostridiales Family XIII bacterium]